MSKYANRLLYTYLFSFLILNLLDYCPIDSDSKLVDNIYYVVSSCLTVGVFCLFYLVGKNKISVKNNKEFISLVVVILIYSSWTLIVNILISIGVGSAGTHFYSWIDMLIIIIGTLWSFASKH